MPSSLTPTAHPALIAPQINPDAVPVSNQEQGQRKPRILCIDDDPDISRTITLRLQDYDVTVDSALYGTQGFWQAAQTRPDLILLDYSMPNGNGSFVLDSLRQKPDTREIPVIMLTGHRNAQLRQTIAARGVAGFLLKPILFEDLVSEIKKHIELSHLPAERWSDISMDHWT